jgi:hypothetical protein
MWMFLQSTINNEIVFDKLWKNTDYIFNYKKETLFFCVHF